SQTMAPASCQIADQIPHATGAMHVGKALLQKCNSHKFFGPSSQARFPDLEYSTPNPIADSWGGSHESSPDTGDDLVSRAYGGSSCLGAGPGSKRRRKCKPGGG